jgi:adenine-specific DNA-methyltransferase
MHSQRSLPLGELEQEDPKFLTQQLVTYIGNKRSLRAHIEAAVGHVRSDLGGRRIRAFDAFSGSGVISRLLKAHADFLVANDIEDYATAISRCYLTNRRDVDWTRIADIAREFNDHADRGASAHGFIERLYAPMEDDRIRPGERVFYTRDNARRLDFFAHCLQQLDETSQSLLMGPLLSAASVHANTAGVFKGFYKDRATGVGRFGGSGGDALDRIKGKIVLREPVLSVFQSETLVSQMDANRVETKGLGLDLVYLDPPYNQHPYGSNYFMLNLLINYQEPERISDVSGIPRDWRRSFYNVKSQAFRCFRDLVAGIDARYVLVSFNDEGFIAPGAMLEFLASLGDVKEIKVPYNTYRGSRNLRERGIHVTEHLYLLRRGR